MVSTCKGAVATCFEAGDHDLRMMRDRARRIDAGLEVRRLGLGFEGIVRAHQPPHLVEAEPLQRCEADLPVRRVRRIERAAEEPDTHVRRRHRHLEVLRRAVAVFLTHAT